MHNVTAHEARANWSRAGTGISRTDDIGKSAIVSGSNGVSRQIGFLLFIGSLEVIRS